MPDELQLEPVMGAQTASVDHDRAVGTLAERFLTFLDAHALPRPKLNVQLDVHGRLLECDCVWRSEGVVVELDGHAAHAPRVAFERWSGARRDIASTA